MTIATIRGFSTKKYFRFILVISIAPVLRRIPDPIEVFPYDSDEALNSFLGDSEVETIGTIIRKPSEKKYEIRVCQTF